MPKSYFEFQWICGVFYCPDSITSSDHHAQSSLVYNQSDNVIFSILWIKQNYFWYLNRYLESNNIIFETSHKRRLYFITSNQTTLKSNTLSTSDFRQLLWTKQLRNRNLRLNCFSDLTSKIQEKCFFLKQNSVDVARIDFYRYSTK